MIGVDNGQVDPVSRRLEALSAEMRARFGDAVVVHRTGGGQCVEMTPRKEGALALYWFDTGVELQVETGGGLGGRWELGRSEGDAAYLEDIVRSVVAGQVEEVFGPGGRSRVTVTLADGVKDAETGFVGLAGCLPRPGWKRLGRHIQYQPWDE